MEKLYYERSGGAFDVWIYDLDNYGKRFFIMRTYDLFRIERYAKRFDMKIIEVK